MSFSEYRASIQDNMAHLAQLPNPLVMEQPMPVYYNVISEQPKLPTFSGKKGSSPTFQEYQLKLIALCREKFIHQALLPIGDELDDNVLMNAAPPTNQGGSVSAKPLNEANAEQKAAEQKAAANALARQKADNSVYNTIITSISGEAFAFASKNFPVNEETPSDAYLGQKLFQGLKERFGRTQSRENGKFYCGRKLGIQTIPGSDGRCGPKNGPQCKDCELADIPQKAPKEKKVKAPKVIDDEPKPSLIQIVSCYINSPPSTSNWLTNNVTPSLLIDECADSVSSRNKVIWELPSIIWIFPKLHQYTFG